MKRFECDENLLENKNILLDADNENLSENKIIPLEPESIIIPLEIGQLVEEESKSQSVSSEKTY